MLGLVQSVGEFPYPDTGPFNDDIGQREMACWLMFDKIYVYASGVAKGEDTGSRDT